MDWRIIAAAVAAVGVLTGGTLLAAQVQGDLDAGVDARLRETAFDRPQDAAPLKLNDFKLPKNVPFDIPAGTEISPDLSKMTLPQDLDLQLPDDLDLSELDFKLPEDFDFKLPEGTQFDPNTGELKLPDGASIKLPDGRDFQFPEGSDLKLPPELVQRLREQGLPPGVLDAARDLPIRGLPPDLHAKLDPPSFDGPGSLHLPAGTTITLPDGQHLPFSAGALAYAARYLLPAGSSLDIPFDAAGSAGGEFPLPRPTTQQGTGGTTNTRATGVDTEITSLPARVRKGEPVTVSGYVREAATGRPIVGAPVDIFMNETKRAPGVLVGQGTSDGTGTFRIKLTLPNDKPARDYQLVNHAVAFVDASGKAYGDGWGDPPFATVASTTITMSLPARDGQGSSTTVNGTLFDNTGAAVPSVTIQLSVDNVVVARPVTGATGRWQVQYSFPAGSHAVEARFTGTPNYDPSNVARGTITIDDFAIEVSPTIRAKPGDGIQISGRVLGKGAAAPDRLVTIDGLLGNPTVSLRSDAAGRFSYSFTASPTQPTGLYTITYRLPDHGVTKLQTLEINQSARISANLPPQWDVEQPLPVTFTLVTTGGQPVPNTQLRITLAGPGGTSDLTVTTDASGVAAPTLAPLRPSEGTYTVTTRVVNSPQLDAPSLVQSLILGKFEVQWSLPTTVARGEDMKASATLRFAGRPLADQAVTVDSFGLRQLSTDREGVVRWTTTIPTVAGLGQKSLTLQALDHPTRSARVEVVAIPKLAFEAPDAFDAGKPFEASLTLTDDQGDPIRNSAVTITAVSGGRVERTVVKTDNRGHWSGPVNVTAIPGTNVTLSARFDPAGPYLAAEGVRTMSVVAPVPRAGPGSLWLLVGLGAVVLAGGGAAAWWWFGRNRSRRVPVVEASAVAPAVAGGPRASDIELRFGIPDGEPRVWGVGEPIDLVARNTGAAGSFQLAWPGGASTIQLGDAREARTTLIFPQEGDINLTAQRQGDSFTPESTTLRIVDYRKETAREFDLFLEKAQAIDASLTRRSTPREIVWTLAGRLGAASEPLLDEIALVMEVTNYSQYDVKRADYLRFVAASRALDAFFAPPAPVPQGG